MHGSYGMARAEQIIGLHQRVPLIIQVTDQFIELRRRKPSQADTQGMIHWHGNVPELRGAISRTASPAGRRPDRQGDKRPASAKNLIKPPGGLRGCPFLAVTQLRDMPRVAGYLAGKLSDAYSALGH
jgi:hypothetical protein